MTSIEVPRIEINVAFDNVPFVKLVGTPSPISFVLCSLNSLFKFSPNPGDFSVASVFDPTFWHFPADWIVFIGPDLEMLSSKRCLSFRSLDFWLFDLVVGDPAFVKVSWNPFFGYFEIAVRVDLDLRSFFTATFAIIASPPFFWLISLKIGLVGRSKLDLLTQT